MRPVRTPRTNQVYTLPGGTRANDLPAEVIAERVPEGLLTEIHTQWELTPEERIAIGEGANLELVILTSDWMPPVSLKVSSEPREIPA